MASQPVAMAVAPEATPDRLAVLSRQTSRLEPATPDRRASRSGLKTAPARLGSVSAGLGSEVSFMSSAQGSPEGRKLSRAQQGGASSMYSVSSRSRSVKTLVSGFQKPFKDVFELQREVRTFAAMISNIWGWSCGRASMLRQAAPGVLRIYDGLGGSVVVPGFLLRDVEGMTREAVPCDSADAPGPPASVAITDVAVQELHVLHPTSMLAPITTLLKLRWLLRLHSACCELDYRLASLKRIIFGIQYLAVQQHSEVTADSVFDSKVSQNVGAHLSLESMLDDILDQLQRALGGSWQGFLEYVSSCDPMRSLCVSKMDRGADTSQVVPNDALAVAVDTIFVAGFLRQPWRPSASLVQLYRDIDALGVAPPQIPFLDDMPNLHIWGRMKQGVLPQSERRMVALQKDMDKLAQLEAVVLTVAVELHSQEVVVEDKADMYISEPSSPTSMRLPQRELAKMPAMPKMEFGDGAGASPDPPASRVIHGRKPSLTASSFEAVTYIVNFHATFPQGIRERLYDILGEEYSMTKEQRERLAIASVQSANGRRLSESALLSMEQKEKARLHRYSADTAKKTSHLLLSSLVAPHGEAGKMPKYARTALARSPSKELLSRSMPSLQQGSTMSGREPFKVWLGVGPLVYDASGALRSTGQFMRMPPLK